MKAIKMMDYSSFSFFARENMSVKKHVFWLPVSFLLPVLPHLQVDNWVSYPVTVARPRPILTDFRLFHYYILLCRSKN